MPVSPAFLKALVDALGLATLGHQILAFTPLWGLLGLKLFDVIVATARAVVTKTIDPGAIKRGPLALLVLVGMIALCVCLRAVSPAFDPVIAIVLMGIAGADAASIVGHLAAIYQATNTPAPVWLDRASAFLHDMPNGGVNAQLSAAVPSLVVPNGGDTAPAAPVLSVDQATPPVAAVIPPDGSGEAPQGG